MVVAACALLVVVAAGPRREADRLVRVLVKRLLEEVRTREPVMHPAGLAAAFDHRGDAGMGLEVARRRPPSAVGAEGGRQPRRADRAGAREAGKDRLVRVSCEPRGDLRVEGGNRGEQGPQLGGVTPDGERVDDRWVARQRLGRGDLLEPGGDHRGPAAVVLLIEPLDGGRAGPLDGGKRGPLGEPVAGLPGVERADPLEGLRELLLEQAGHPVRQAPAEIDQFPPVFAQQLELARRDRIGPPGPELGTVGPDQVEQERRIGRVVLRPGGVEGFTITRQGLGLMG